MISAVVLFNTDSGAQDKVLENIKLVGGFEEAQPLYGVYDLLIKIKGNSVDKLKEITKFRIKSIGALIVLGH